MKLIVGLGNPESKFSTTYHNLGFVVLETVAKQDAESWQKFSDKSRIYKLNKFTALLLQPQTFMNNSGLSVSEIMTFYKILPTDLWVIHDDLDLPVGEIKISYDSSSAGHKGVQSIIDSLGTQAFWRFRIGIGRPSTNIPPEAYVLKSPEADEATKISTAVSETAKLLMLALAENIKIAQQAGNKK